MSVVFTPRLRADDVERLKTVLPNLPDDKKRELTELLDQYQSQVARLTGKDNFLAFIKHVYPGYLVGPHHRRLAQIFEEIAEGKKKRVIVNIAPRHGKSELISYLAPAWYLGKYPNKKVIMASHTADLAVNFGRRVRNLVGSDLYHDIFPQVELQADSKSASRWGTNHNGEYFAIGVGGALAGRGADLFIIDDPHALPLDTEVPTPYGFTTIGELKIGDHVYGPDGKPVKVIAKSEVRKNRELYRVTTDDNHEVLCDSGHLWTYHSATNLKYSHIVKTATARELATWSKPNKPYLPRHAAVQYPERVLPIDPYVLGAWLGDGTSSVGRITSHPDDMPFMREQFEQAGYTTTTLTDSYSFGVKTLWTHLKNVGLLNNKHIPEVYMTSSVPQRFALVQGLMDTDGNVTAEGECSFNNTNELLARQFRELINSLGVKAKIRVYYDSRPNHPPVYRVNFKLADCCRMPRKRERTYTPTDKRRRSLTVVPTELRADVQCITVDRSDGLFLVGRGYVVTHNSEQEAKQGLPQVFEPAWEWFQSGPIQRLMPGGAIIVVMTRWSKSDLTGMIVDHMVKHDDADQWEIVEFPAVLNDQPLWPEFWSMDELMAKKASMDVRYWQAQYMQQPTAEEGALIKRDWWRVWEKDDPPPCEFMIMALDAAQEKNSRADYNALTTWGVFYNEQEKANQIILLNSIKERMEYPELKALVLKEYEEWQPDSLIVEKKSNGAVLYQEMRRMGVPVMEFTPSRGQDKISRVNAVTDLFSSGVVWLPDRRWAWEVAEECNDFPSGRNDDLVDSTTLALLRFRQGGFVRLPSDEPEPIQLFKSARHRGYY